MANQFNQVIVSSNPKGNYLPIIVSGTPKPGQCMTMKAATEPVNGRFTFEPWNRDGDGNRAEVAVLLANESEGQLITTEYVTGTLATVYFPQPGDFLQMLIQDVAGTGDTKAIGDYLMIDDGTGALLATSSPETEPFKLAETLAALTDDTHALCMFTGY